MSNCTSSGIFVRKHRLALGLTQVELSSRVDRATITIRKIVAGVLRPSAKTVKRLAWPWIFHWMNSQLSSAWLKSRNRRNFQHFEVSAFMSDIRW